MDLAAPPPSYSDSLNLPTVRENQVQPSQPNLERHDQSFQESNDRILSSVGDDTVSNKEKYQKSNYIPDETLVKLHEEDNTSHGEPSPKPYTHHLRNMAIDTDPLVNNPASERQSGACAEPGRPSEFRNIDDEESDDETHYKEKCGGLNIQSFFGFLFSAGCIIMLILIFILDNSYSQRAGLIAGVVLTYIAALIEAFLSPTFGYLMFNSSHAQVRDYIDEIRQTNPVIEFKCECFHYETEIYYDQGKVKERKKRVVTHKGHHEFKCDTWDDESDQRLKIDPRRTTRVKFVDEIKGADPYSELMLERQYDAFISENRSRDHQITGSKKKHLPNKTKYIQVSRHSNKLLKFVFCILALLSLSLVFRACYTHLTDYTRIRFVKLYKFTDNRYSGR